MSKDKLVKGSIWVLITIALIFFFFSREAPGAEMYLELGPSIVSNEHSDSFTMILQQRWASKYAVSLGYISSQYIDTCNTPNRPDCKWDIQEQLLVGAERLVTGNFDGRWRWLNRVTFSIGPYWFQNANRISSCKFLVRLGGAVRITDSLSIKASHFSNAGSCPTITLLNPKDTRGPQPIPITGKFNVGQDALLLTWLF